MTFIAFALALPRANAHQPGESAGASIWISWNLEPWILALLAASAVLYALGVARLWRRAGPGRGISPGDAARFAAGWLALAVAMLSPVDTLGGALFSMHMIQHELLMVVAAPLFVAARPVEAWTWALAPPWRRLVAGFFRRRAWASAWRAITDPLCAWTLHAIALWAWHVPVLFEAGLADEHIHELQHASFFATALLFWWTVAGRGLHRADGVALASLFTTMLHTGALGALLTFAPRPWYGHYAESTLAFGLTALEDQQLGGLLMWVPGGAAYLLVGLAIVAAWLQAPAARQPLR